MGADPNEYDVGELRELAGDEQGGADAEPSDSDGDADDGSPAADGFVWFRHGVVVDRATPGAERTDAWAATGRPADDEGVLASALFEDLAHRVADAPPAVDPASVAEDPILGDEPVSPEPGAESNGDERPAADPLDDVTERVVDPESLAEDPIIETEFDPSGPVVDRDGATDDRGESGADGAERPGDDGDPDDAGESTWAKLDRIDDPSSVAPELESDRDDGPATDPGSGSAGSDPGADALDGPEFGAGGDAADGSDPDGIDGPGFDAEPEDDPGFDAEPEDDPGFDAEPEDGPEFDAEPEDGPGFGVDLDDASEFEADPGDESAFEVDPDEESVFEVDPGEESAFGSDAGWDADPSTDAGADDDGATSGAEEDATTSGAGTDEDEGADEDEGPDGSGSDGAGVNWVDLPGDGE